MSDPLDESHEASYLRVLTAYPSHDEALTGLSALYRQQGRLEDALAAYGRAILHSPGDAALWFARGVLALERAGQLADPAGGHEAATRRQGAIEDLRRAASLGHAEAPVVLRRDLGVEPPSETDARGFGIADFRMMLNDEDRGLIDGLYEGTDGWTFGGPLVISKGRPCYVEAGRPRPLPRDAHFYRQWFELDTGAKGWAVVFDRAPSGALLCGWVRPDREAELTRWLDFLNTMIRRHVAAMIAAIDPDERARQSIAMFRALGIPMPEARSMDELMDKLDEASRADAPLSGHQPFASSDKSGRG